ncbi:MAG: BrnT family toxin [Crocosphaera sp.]|nr:BrnT family toxin [Crocosphaera sp.]
MFEWDDSKAKSNEIKHSVSFPFATRVFDDGNRLTVIDERFQYGEVRYIVLGKIEQRIYVVAYTIRGSVIRLISARKANSREVKRYENS